MEQVHRHTHKWATLQLTKSLIKQAVYVPFLLSQVGLSLISRWLECLVSTWLQGAQTLWTEQIETNCRRPLSFRELCIQSTLGWLYVATRLRSPGLASSSTPCRWHWSERMHHFSLCYSSTVGLHRGQCTRSFTYLWACAVNHPAPQWPSVLSVFSDLCSSGAGPHCLLVSSCLHKSWIRDPFIWV